MVSPHKIRYNNISSNELNVLDLIMEVSFDSESGETSSHLNREAVVSETYDGRRKYVGRYKYNESFSPRFTFVKKNFGDFTQEEMRQVLKWLTSKDTTAVLDVFYDHEDDSETVDWSAIGNWTEISTYKLANNRTVGIVATFEAVTPFAMSDIWMHTISADDNYKETINIDTDDNQPIYPRITIKQKGTVVSIPVDTTLDMYSDMVPNTVYYNGTNYYWKSDEPALVTGAVEPDYGWNKVTIDTVYTTTDEIKEETVYYYTSDQKYRWIDPYTFKSSTSDPKLTTTGVKITNRHYDILDRFTGVSTMSIKNSTATETVIIDGANKVISSSNTRRIFGDDFDWTWLPLYDGKNELTIEGNCSVEFSYREVRKIGEY